MPDYSQSLREDIAGLTIGVPRHYFFTPDDSVNAEVVSTVEKGLEELEKLGAHVVEVSIPSLQYARSANTVIMLTEAYAFHGAEPEDPPQRLRRERPVPVPHRRLLSANDYIQAQRVRKLVIREFAEVLRGVDVLVTPTMTQPAAAFEGYDPHTTVRGPSFTGPFNLTGLPAISVPCGFTANGLPVGMQIAGKPFDEPTILRAAYTYQQHARWFERRPPI